MPTTMYRIRYKTVDAEGVVSQGVTETPQDMNEYARNFKNWEGPCSVVLDLLAVFEVQDSVSSQESLIILGFDAYDGFLP